MMHVADGQVSEYSTRFHLAGRVGCAMDATAASTRRVARCRSSGHPAAGVLLFHGRCVAPAGPDLVAGGAPIQTGVADAATGMRLVSKLQGPSGRLPCEGPCP